MAEARVEILMVGGPSKGSAEIRQLEREPVIGLPLSTAVPQGEHVGFLPREIVGVRGAELVGLTRSHELFFGELSDGFEHRESGPLRRPVGDQK